MSPLNDQNLTSFIVEAVNAEKQLFLLIHTKGLLHIDVMKLYHKARSSYEKIILNDHELAELQDVEFSLWKLHYKHIDEYRNELRQSSNKEGQNLVLVQKHNKDDLLEGFKSFLSDATEFYQDLITKIRRSYGSLVEPLVFHEVGFSNSTESSEMLRCLFSCHRCLVCLGDLARYRELYGRPDTQNRNWSFAATHYLNASMIWPDSGNPQNQLAVLATYLGDELLALYHCIRSLAVKEPFPDAWNNLILLFETNSSAYMKFSSHDVAFDFRKPSERSTLLAKAQSSEDVAANEDAHSSDQTALWSLIVRMIGFFYTKPSLEDFPCAFGSTILQLEALLSLEDASLKVAFESYQSMNISRTGPFRALQLVTILIFTIHTLSNSPTFENPKQIEHKQQPALIQQALASTFIIMGRFVGRSMKVNAVEDSPLLPAILIFVEWLVEMLDKVEAYDADEKRDQSMGYFFGAFANLLNQLDDNVCDIKPSDYIALWEDHELRGFLPVVQSHAPLDFSTQREPTNSIGHRHDLKVRVNRIRNAGMKIANGLNSSRKWILYDENGRKFFAAESKELLGGGELTATASDPDIQASDSRQDVLPPIKESGDVVSEGDQANLNERINSTLVDEEEVILFKPIKRYNSGQLPSNQQVCGDPSDLGLNTTGPRLKKISWKEPLEEFSGTNPCTAQSEDAKTGGVLSLSAPPSLNGWVNIEDLSITGKEVKKDPARYGSESTEDFASTCLTGLPVSRPALSQQEVKINSSSPAPQFAYGLSPEKDYATSTQHSSFTPDYLTPAYMPPLPSAPLLPDDATNWSSSDSSSYSECKDFEDVKEHSPFTSQVNSYSKFTGTQGSPNFDPSIPRFSYEHSPILNRVDYFQRPQWYMENPNKDQVHDNVWPNQYYSPTYHGQFHDRQEHSRLALFDRCANPLTSTFADVEKTKEKLIRGEGYNAAMKSEQQLLLQYLKTKELRLQIEAELRRPL